MPDHTDSAEIQEKDRWNKRSILVNFVLFMLKLVVGVFTMSMAILSDAIDSGIDVVTSAMARYSVKIANEPADERHTYGHGKFENLSGFIQAIIVVVIFMCRFNADVAESTARWEAARQGRTKMRSKRAAGQRTALEAHASGTEQRSPTTYCARCGRAHVDEDKACPSCGHRIIGLPLS